MIMWCYLSDKCLTVSLHNAWWVTTSMWLFYSLWKSSICCGTLQLLLFCILSRICNLRSSRTMHPGTCRHLLLQLTSIDWTSSWELKFCFNVVFCFHPVPHQLESPQAGARPPVFVQLIQRCTHACTQSNTDSNTWPCCVWPPLLHVSGLQWDFLSPHTQPRCKHTHTHTHIWFHKHLQADSHTTVQMGSHSYIQGTSQIGATLKSVPRKIGSLPQCKFHGLWGMQLLSNSRAVSPSPISILV